MDYIHTVQYYETDKMGITHHSKVSTTFPDRIFICVSVESFKGVKLHLYYEMKNESGTTVCTGKSTHAFLDSSGRPVKMKQEFPELYRTLTELADH